MSSLDGIYYEVRGSGPALLLIPGGNGDGGLYERVAIELADRYTVINYDRRGFSRSPLDGPADDRLATDSEDARRLLAHVSDEPGFVFGSSSGAIVALDLLTRCPDRIRTLIAHEPPAMMLLPDSATFEALFDEVYEIYRSQGTGPAMQRFDAAIGLETMSRPEGAQLPPAVLEMMGRIQQNLAFWFEHELRQYTRFVPDTDALKAVAGKLLLAGGHDSREQFPYRPNTVLADQLGTKVVDFAGGHAGYVTHPAEFSAQLDRVLTGGLAESADQAGLS